MKIKRNKNTRRLIKVAVENNAIEKKIEKKIFHQCDIVIAILT